MLNYFVVYIDEILDLLYPQRDEQPPEADEIEDILSGLEPIKIKDFRFMLGDKINLDTLMLYETEENYKKVENYLERNNLPYMFVVTDIKLYRDLADEDDHYGCEVHLKQCKRSVNYER